MPVVSPGQGGTMPTRTTLTCVDAPHDESGSSLADLLGHVPTPLQQDPLLVVFRGTEVGDLLLHAWSNGSPHRMLPLLVTAVRRSEKDRA